MKVKLSTIAGLTVVALALAAPAALAEPGPPRDWFEHAAKAARDSGATPYVDAFERPDTASRRIEVAPDSFDGATAPAVRDADATPYADAFERPEITSVQPTNPTVADTGSGRAWLELGIAFAIGLTLALGLVALMRIRLNRPLAQ